MKKGELGKKESVKANLGEFYWILEQLGDTPLGRCSRVFPGPIS